MKFRYGTDWTNLEMCMFEWTVPTAKTAGKKSVHDKKSAPQELLSTYIHFMSNF